MDLQFDSVEIKISNRQREGFIHLHECNFYKVLNISRQFFACFKDISLATLDQLYTASVSESWLSDEDQYHITIKPVIIAPYPALEFLDEYPIWENVVGNNIALGFPINPIPMDSENISRNTG